jgi:hypothetical protein
MGHSKSLRHHAAMQALFVAWYNFGRKHETLKGNTPAMASDGQRAKRPRMDDQRADRAGGRIKFRKLRIVFSATWLAACVLLIVFWLRSYWWEDLLHFEPNTPTVYAVRSSKGHLFLLRSYDGRRAAGRVLVMRELPSSNLKPLVWHSEITKARTRDVMLLPFWMPVLLATIFAVLPWIHWAKRFSLRTLFIATTLVAVVLGLAVYAARK